MVSFLNPQKILDQLELRPEMRAADFGCGSGHWTIPLAKKLKQGEVYGFVYGIDILEEPLSVLQQKLQAQDITNLKIIRADLEKEKGSTLPAYSLDFILATNLFFQIADKQAIMKEVKRVLKPDGQVLVIDWLVDAPLGPKQGRVSVEEMRNLAKKFGFEVKREFKAGIYHWGMVLVRGGGY